LGRRRERDFRRRRRYLSHAHAPLI
jgi:hypothetical protein